MSFFGSTIQYSPCSTTIYFCRDGSFLFIFYSHLYSDFNRMGWVIGLTADPGFGFWKFWHWWWPAMEPTVPYTTRGGILKTLDDQSLGESVVWPTLWLTGQADSHLWCHPKPVPTPQKRCHWSQTTHDEGILRDKTDAIIAGVPPSHGETPVWILNNFISSGILSPHTANTLLTSPMVWL